MRPIDSSAASERSLLPGVLVGFFSPTIYCLFLMLADGLRLPSPPDAVVASVFYLLPVVALLVCRALICSAARTSAHKTWWMVALVFGMVLQTGGLLAVMLAATGG